MFLSLPQSFDAAAFRRIGLVSLAALAFCFVVFFHGLVPGYLFPSVGGPLLVSAQGESLALGSLFAYPHHFGHPLGAPIVFGAPLVYTQALLMRGLAVSGVEAYVIANWLILGLAFIGCRGLLRHFEVPDALASVSAALYLCSLFVLGHQAFSALMLGFAVLPLSILLDVRLSKAFGARDRPLRLRTVLLAVASIVFRSCLIFLDGYTFVISAVFAVCFVCFAFFERPPVLWSRWLSYGLVVSISYAIAYVLYRWYIPGGGDYTTMPVDFFRAQGVDLATIVLPLNNSTQLASWLNLSPHYTSSQFYGDGSNAFNNYAGISLLVAAGGAVVVWRTHRYARPMITAGLICLFLSLGPSLKVLSIRSMGQARKTVSFSDYLMPQEEAIVSLHTERLYTKAPGIRAMRAVYRWLVGFKLTVLVCCALAISALFKRGPFVLAAVALLCLIAVDSIPPVRQRFRLYSEFEKAKTEFYSGLIPEMKGLVPQGSLVLFVSSENDYLADPIATALKVRTYNVGGDKNIDLSAALWPPEVKAIRAKKDILGMASQLHAQGGLDVLIFPHFNLRWDSYRWPPSSTEVERTKASVRKLVAESNVEGLQVTESRYVTTVTFRPTPPQGSADTPTPAG